MGLEADFAFRICRASVSLIVRRIATKKTARMPMQHIRAVMEAAVQHSQNRASLHRFGIARTLTAPGNAKTISLRECLQPLRWAKAEMSFKLVMIDLSCRIKTNIPFSHLILHQHSS
jgi:hypothetical protein